MRSLEFLYFCKSDTLHFCLSVSWNIFLFEIQYIIHRPLKSQYVITGSNFILKKIFYMHFRFTMSKNVLTLIKAIVYMTALKVYLVMFSDVAIILITHITVKFSISLKLSPFTYWNLWIHSYRLKICFFKPIVLSILLLKANFIISEHKNYAALGL